MRCEAGDLVLVPFPYTDLSSKKRRPALVLSPGEYNGAGQDIILCGVTSNLRNADFTVLIDQEDMASGQIARPSRAKADKVMTLHQTIIQRRLGQVTDQTLQRVLRELRTVLAMP